MDPRIHAGLDREIHCPASGGPRTIGCMATSAGGRFRPGSLPAPPPQPQRTDSGSFVLFVPPPAPVALTDLLKGYRALMQVADQLPSMLTVRAGNGRFTRHVKVPRSRLFLHWFLNQHVSRRAAHLGRAFHADAAVGIDRAGELAALDHFGQAVSPVPGRRIFVSFAVSVIFVAIAIANVGRALWPHALEEASSALRGSVASVVSVDTNGLIDAAGRFHADSGAAAVIVISLALYVISWLPITSFRLKRMLMNLRLSEPEQLADAAALDHVARAHGVYHDERDAFEALEVSPPREIPFDLIAQATLMLLPLLLGVSLLAAYLADQLRAPTLGTSIQFGALVWLCLVVPLGRLAHIASIWKRRVADFDGAPQAPPFAREELCLPSRRFGAFVVDTTLGLGLAALLAAPLVASGVSDFGSMLWLFVGVPVAFGLVTFPFMVRSGRHAGQSLGKQLFGLRVVTDDHAPITGGRSAARELVVKAPLLGSISLAFIPLIVNGVWSILDPERRGLQDRAAGTRVVRANAPEQ
jgi:uncharacterized RDD family membrane protein YckC